MKSIRFWFGAVIGFGLAFGILFLTSLITMNLIRESERTWTWVVGVMVSIAILIFTVKRLRDIKNRF